MSRPRSREFLEKSISAMISAIDAYNKPDHKYRIETFSILAINAWEIFFKAKILLEKKNNMTSIYVYKTKNLKNGNVSKRKYIEKNRTGNPKTIGLNAAMSIIENEKLEKIDEKVKENIKGLMEIRDCSVHSINIKEGLSKEVQEIGGATLINFVELSKLWFQTDLSKYDIYLMPLAFFKNFDSAFSVNLTKEEENLAKYLHKIENNLTKDDEQSPYAFALKMEIKLEKSQLSTATKLKIGQSSNAVPIFLTEEELLKRYPWDYKTLYEKLKKRYDDFKQNSKFHDIRKGCYGNNNYVHTRYLDPNNKNSQKKTYYSPNILNEFNKHYNCSKN